MGTDSTSIRRFSDLTAWQEAKRFAVASYSVTERFPSSEQFGLTSQIRRAAVSIPANIAEGFARRTSKDKRNFYQTALASLSEVESHLLIAQELDFISHEALNGLRKQMNTVGKLLTGLARSAADKS